MVVVCDYSRAERDCCRPSHSYRFVVGNMLILVGIIFEKRSLSDKFIIGRVTVGNIVRFAVCTVRTIGATMQHYYGDYPKASCPLELCYLLWQGECNYRRSKLKANEEELNRIFIEIYG